jgi:hypothetical protein
VSGGLAVAPVAPSQQQQQQQQQHSDGESAQDERSYDWKPLLAATVTHTVGQFDVDKINDTVMSRHRSSHMPTSAQVSAGSTVLMCLCTCDAVCY